ncbi:hypothetical protein GCM10009430_27360 [Aquimarina litoralis]|uniref:PKD domain-containing protein n=1 Tax=Aquimarina litoralis TaxID=584605 RepID=A0ABP3U5I8_9FLAO
MRLLKFIPILTILASIFVGCNDDDISYAFEGISAPTDVNAVFDITQDDTGLVSITPSATSASSFEIYFGDTDNEEATVISPGSTAEHIYQEGTYTARVVAVGATGLTSEFSQVVVVSFRAPENLVVTLDQDTVNPAIVRVSASADFATLFDVYFGDVENEEPTIIMPGETVEHTYENPGDYTVRVVARGAGAATTETTQLVTITAATDPVTLPIDFESFTINYGFTSFGNATAQVIDNPNQLDINTSARVGQLTKPTGAEVWAGTFLQLENPIDFSTNKLFRVKVFAPKSGITVKLKVENATDANIGYEVDAVNTIANEWEELEFDFSAIDTNNEYQKVVIFFDFGVAGDDSVYLFDDVTLTTNMTASIEGVWKLAPEAGALGVGPAPGDTSWFACDDACVAERACYYDDLYVFDIDGTFSNVLGDQTWIEGWQGGSDACGTPVAPYDGNNVATYTYDQAAGTLTVNGTGAYIGLPKANNQGELPNVAVPSSITYNISFIDNNTISVIVESGAGVFWQYRLIRETYSTPIEGVWKLAPEAGALGVGPAPGDTSWFACDDACVAERACYYNDLYVFSADGTFSNVLNGESWIEGWQGGSDACGTPVTPHDGSNPATYTYDQSAGTVTITGTGAYIGLAKANNQGELPNVAVPGAITYDITFHDVNTMSVIVEAGSGVFWQYRLIRL